MDEALELARSFAIPRQAAQSTNPPKMMIAARISLSLGASRDDREADRERDASDEGFHLSTPVQSSFAPLSLTSLAHLARSASMNRRKSSGVVPAGSEPSATMRSRTSGRLRILTNSSCSRVTMVLGSP